MNKLSKTMVIAGGLTLSGVLVAGLAVAGNSSHHHKRCHIFGATMLDTDGDGALTKDELLAHNRARFDRLDRNDDGMISPDEFGEQLVAMFTRMDVDNDGLLSGEELPRRMGRTGHQGNHHQGHHHGTPEAMAGES